jgi:two-component system LytT family response regulator
MNGIRTLIIDDERSARNELKRALAAYPDFLLVGEAADADEAETLIRQLQPDLLLLDIQMPGRSGFDLLESLTEVPAVIFVTAYDKYALQAFEVSAVDYLLKPVRDERLAKAMEEARQRIQNGNGRFVFIKDGSKFHLVRWNEVVLIESADPYVRLHLKNNRLLLKTSLTQLETTLDDTFFLRANRWQLVNLRFIDSIHQKEGALTALLTTGDEIVFSERQSTAFKKSQKHL